VEGVGLELSQIGMAKSGGPRGPARSPLIKNVGRAHLFNLLTRISPPCITCGLTTGRAGVQARKPKNKLTLAAME